MLMLQNDRCMMPQDVVNAGRFMELCGVEGRGLMLAAFRSLVEGLRGHSRVALVPVEGGFVLRATVGQMPSCWLVAERSQELRVFRRAETAFGVCRQMGLGQVTVDLAEPQPLVRQ